MFGDYRIMIEEFGVVGAGTSVPWICVWHCAQFVYRACRIPGRVSMPAAFTVGWPEAAVVRWPTWHRRHRKVGG